MKKSEKNLLDKLRKNSEIKRKSRQAAREIIIPDVISPQNVIQATADPIFFLTHYLPNWFKNTFSTTHLEIIDLYQQAINRSDIATVVLPRGSGKSTIAKGMILWLLLTRPNQYILLITAESGMSKRSLNDIQAELLNNDLLYQDFPGACAVARTIDGVANRAKSIYYKGKHANVTWSSNVLQLGNIEGFIGSGNIITTTSIGGNIRGAQKRSADGSILRPSLVLCDDLVKDKNSSSIKEQDHLESIFRNSIMNLGGHQDGCGMIICGTIMSEFDLMSRFSNIDLNSNFHAIKYPAIINFPSSWEKEWVTYFSLRDDEDRQRDLEHKSSTAYYVANHDVMVSGFSVYWDIFDNKRGEIDCYQHWANIYKKLGHDSFFTEYQHTPKITKSTLLHIEYNDILKSSNNIHLMTVPDAKDAVITVGIDINTSRGLSYTVLSTDSMNRSNVIGYGIYCMGNRGFIYKSGVSDETEIVCLTRTLISLLNELTSAKIIDTSGNQCHIKSIGIDIGYMTREVIDLIIKFNESKQYPMIIIPVRGRDAKSIMFGKRITRQGEYWNISNWDQGPVMVINVDAGKEKCHQSFLLPYKRANSLSINASKENNNHWVDFARQICNEKLINKLSDNKYTVYQWQVTGPNDLLDSTVYAKAQASYWGIIQRPNDTSTSQVLNESGITKKNIPIRQQSPVTYDSSFAGSGW